MHAVVLGAVSLGVGTLRLFLFLDFLYIVFSSGRASLSLLFVVLYRVHCTVHCPRLDLTRTFYNRQVTGTCHCFLWKVFHAFTRRRVYARVFQASPLSRLSSSARATTVSIFVSIFKNTFHNTASAAALQMDDED